MNARLPLNEPQVRRLSVILTGLEQALRELRSSALHPAESSLLTDYEDPVDPALAKPLLGRISQVETTVGQMARDLDLPKSRTSILRRHLASLQLLSIDLDTTRPSAGLSGYGPVAPPTARYLEAMVPKLEALVEDIVRLLEHGH